MQMQILSRAALAAALASTLLWPQIADAGRRRGGGGFQHEKVGQQTFASPQAEPIALSPTQNRLYVANTAAGRVNVIDTLSNVVIKSVEVGMDPVSVAVRPDGLEVWVSNHVSDSVSVIDTDPTSASLHQVVETIQDVDGDLVTEFDEPVGIAFASNSKAYVALSSRDQIAIVDATTYSVTGTIDINAQEPRAIAVRGGSLYVLPLESGNQTELSTCPGFNENGPNPQPGDQCTFDQANHNFAQNPQLVGAIVDIVRDPDVPDRDLYVYDTSNDSQSDVVSGVGTLLYGLAVSSTGDVFISMTEGRNDANGAAGTGGEGLVDLENRMFLNQIGTVSCGGGSCGSPGVIDLEPLPPSNPAAGDQLATPYGIQISGDDSTLVVTAAASSRVFTVDTGSGNVLDRLDVGAIPRGVALLSDGAGAPQTAYVLNTVGKSVTVVDVSNPSSLSASATIPLPGDPTPNNIRLGRIAFNDANASSNGTFACASCHPDGNTDQLLWVIGAECVFGGCDQEELRSTMPVRGLRDTLPLHWDGVLGDPVGGTNGELETLLFGGGPTAPANCGPNGGGGNCFRQLVDAAIGGVMCDQVPSCANGPAGLPGPLTATERDNMAAFLENVSYPPARSRRPDDALTAGAVDGFDDFFFDQGGLTLGPETCADAAGGCHSLPWGTGTNSNFVGGFDAPTMRGITDRWLQFSVGITNVEEQLVFSAFTSDVTWTPELGFDELAVWAQAFGTVANPGAFRNVYNVGPLDIFEGMIEEMSTGYAGAQGRQVTLNTRTTDAMTPAVLAETEAIMSALEAADDAGLVNLRAVGLRSGSAVEFSYVAGAGVYRTISSFERTHAQLVSEAQSGTTLVTLTGALRANVGKSGFDPPGLAVPSVGDSINNGRLELPVLPGDNPMDVRGINVRSTATILVDGAPVSGTLTCPAGFTTTGCPVNIAFPTSINMTIELDTVPSSGLHFLQVQSPRGLLSNELPFTVE